MLSFWDTWFAHFDGLIGWYKISNQHDLSRQWIILLPLSVCGILTTEVVINNLNIQQLYLYQQYLSSVCFKLSGFMALNDFKDYFAAHLQRDLGGLLSLLWWETGIQLNVSLLSTDCILLMLIPAYKAKFVLYLRTCYD